MKKTLIAFAYLLSLFAVANAQRANINPLTNADTFDKWRQGKLGMFVHWMVCHTPETGDSWSIGNGTPKSVADSITYAWNPVNFDAEAQVAAAAEAGCKYIVVVAKHHDGFAIWDTDFGDFDIEKVEFKRDILAETADACRRHNIMFGVYLSFADIDYMGWDKMYGDNEPSPEPKTGREDFMRYTKGQIKEIIDRYDPEILWWDGYWQPPVWNTIEGKYIYDYVKSLNPNIIMPRGSLTNHQSKSGRFYSFQSDGADGDWFAIEGKTIEAAPYPWEIATAITYPAYAYEEDAPLISKDKLILQFNNTICGNGNMLLNLGPTPKGELDAKHVGRLYDLGKWIEDNKKAVYSTEGGPFRQGDWGGSTFKGSKLYIHLREARDLDEIVINTLPSVFEVVGAKDLKTGEPVEFTNTKSNSRTTTITIKVPKFSKDRELPVLELSMNRVLYFTEWLPLQK